MNIRKIEEPKERKRTRKTTKRTRTWFCDIVLIILDKCHFPGSVSFIVSQIICDVKVVREGVR